MRAYHGVVENIQSYTIYTHVPCCRLVPAESCAVFLRTLSACMPSTHRSSCLVLSCLVLSCLVVLRRHF